jgi:hypothetical protein
MYETEPRLVDVFGETLFVKRFSLKLFTDGSGCCSRYLSRTAASIPIWQWVIRIFVRLPFEVSLYKMLARKGGGIYDLALICVFILQCGASTLTVIIGEYLINRRCRSVPLSVGKGLIGQHDRLAFAQAHRDSSVVDRAELILAAGGEITLFQRHFVKFFEVTGFLALKLGFVVKFPHRDDYNL